jgi:hypothetical protein
MAKQESNQASSKRNPQASCVSVTYPGVDQFSPTLISTSQWLLLVHSVRTVSMPLTSAKGDTGPHYQQLPMFSYSPKYGLKNRK